MLQMHAAPLFCREVLQRKDDGAEYHELDRCRHTLPDAVLKDKEWAAYISRKTVTKNT